MRILSPKILLKDKSLGSKLLRMSSKFAISSSVASSISFFFGAMKLFQFSNRHYYKYSYECFPFLIISLFYSKVKSFCAHSGLLIRKNQTVNEILTNFFSAFLKYGPISGCVTPQLAS